LKSKSLIRLLKKVEELEEFEKVVKEFNLKQRLSSIFLECYNFDSIQSNITKILKDLKLVVRDDQHADI
jgi:hypothetical protein